MNRGDLGAPKISYPRSQIRHYIDPRPGALRIAVMTRSNGEPDAGADNALAVERREAQRPGGGPRKPATAGRARLRTGLASLSDKARSVSGLTHRAPQGRRSAAPWRLPALHFSLRRGTGIREGCTRTLTNGRRSVGYVHSVMAGRVPAIQVLLGEQSRGCPRQARA
jgi:hypothetical protein